jgi:inner membrane transporter RhtA
MTVCFFEAVRRLPLGLTTTIAFLGPLGVATLGSRRATDLGWALLAAVGVVLLVRPQASGWLVDTAGLALALVAAGCWAGYILLAKRVGAMFEGLQGLSVSLVVAAAVVTPLGMAQLHGWPRPSQLMATAGLAILAPVLPCGLEMTALRRMKARTFGVLMSLEPAIGVTIGYLALRQQPSTAQLLGVLCVVVASAGVVAVADRPRAAD